MEATESTAIAVDIDDETVASGQSEALELKRLRASANVSLLALGGLLWLAFLVGSFAIHRPAAVAAVSTIDAFLWATNIAYVSLMCYRFLHGVDAPDATASREAESDAAVVPGIQETDQIIAVVGDVCLNVMGVLLLSYTGLRSSSFLE